MIRWAIGYGTGSFMNGVAETGFLLFLGRGLYKRAAGKITHRNGSFTMKFTTDRSVKLPFHIPWDHQGGFTPPGNSDGSFFLTKVKSVVKPLYPWEAMGGYKRLIKFRTLFLPVSLNYSTYEGNI